MKVYFVSDSVYAGISRLTVVKLNRDLEIFQKYYDNFWRFDTPASKVLLNMDNDFNNRISDLYELFFFKLSVYFLVVNTNKQHTHAQVFFSVFSVTFVLHDPPDNSVLPNLTKSEILLNKIRHVYNS